MYGQALSPSEKTSWYIANRWQAMFREQRGSPGNSSTLPPNPAWAQALFQGQTRRPKQPKDSGLSSNSSPHTGRCHVLIKRCLLRGPWGGLFDTPYNWSKGIEIMTVEQCSTQNSNRKHYRDFPGGAVVKNPPANAGDMGLSPGPGRSHMPWSN